jgi:type VI secretion system secreted protein Hcp
MAVDMFLKLGDIKGESKDRAHKEEIDVLSWSWGASNAGSFHMGGGGGAGKVNVQDLSFTKYVDLASTEVFLTCCNGKHIPEATLIVRKAGETPLEYLTVKMTDVLITSYSTGGRGGEDKLTENVSLNFAKVAVTYKEQAERGAQAKAPTVGWDIQANAPL